MPNCVETDLAAVLLENARLKEQSPRSLMSSSPQGSNGLSLPRRAVRLNPIVSPIFSKEKQVEESQELVSVICLGSAGQHRVGFPLLEELAPAGCRIFLLELPEQTLHDEPQLEAIERSVALVEDFVLKSQTRPAILLGAEWGAAVAIAYASRHPEAVSGLILCQPFGLLPPRIEHHGSLLARMIKSIRGGEKPLQAAEHPWQDRATLGNNLRAVLETIACPVLAALSKANRAVPALPFQRMLAELDGGRQHLRLVLFTGRRTPLEDDPERLARVVSGFAAATLPLEQHRHNWTLAAVDWPAQGMNQWKCTHPGCHAEQALAVDERP